MALIFWNGLPLFDNGQIALDEECCCVEECCTDCPRYDYKIGSTPASVPPLNFTVAGAIVASGTLDYILPSQGSRCWEFDSGPITPTSDCGGSFGEIRIRVWCDPTKPSGQQIRALMTFPGGNCNASPDLPDNEVATATCDPFYVIQDYTVFELIPGFCDPCNAGDGIVLDIFE